MDSMPPATIGPDRSPARTYWSARPTARRLEAQTLFTVSEGTSLGMPPLIWAWREGTWPWPAWRTWPNTTCSTCSGATSARSRAPRMAVPPSSIASTEARAPPILPKGVRAVPRMTVLGMRARIVTGRGVPRPAPRLSVQLAYGQDDAPERLVGDARERRIPSKDRSRDPQPSACVDDRLRAVRVTDAEHDERDGKEQEHEVDGHRHAERCDPHVGGEDAPRDQVQADGLAQMRRRDLRTLELLEHEKRDPKRPKGRERGRSERVVVPELPHPRQELCDAAVCECQAEHDRHSLVADKARVEKAQHESGERKRGEAERCRVSDRRSDWGHDSCSLFDGAFSVRLTANRSGFHELPPSEVGIPGGTRLHSRAWQSRSPWEPAPALRIRRSCRFSRTSRSTDRSRRSSNPARR